MAKPSMEHAPLEQVQKTISPVLGEEAVGDLSAADVRRICQYTIGTLKKNARVITQTPETAVLPELLQTVDLCCKGYLALKDHESVTGQIDVLHVPRMLQVVACKLPPVTGATDYMMVGHHILNSLPTVHRPDQDAVVSASYVAFWNAGISLQKQKGTNPLEVFQVMFLAVRILSSVPSKAETVVAKARQILNMLEQSESKGQNLERNLVTAVTQALELLDRVMPHVERKSLLGLVNTLFQLLFYSHLMKHVAIMQEFFTHKLRSPPAILDGEVSQFLSNLWTLGAAMATISSRKLEPSSDTVDLDTHLHDILTWTQMSASSGVASPDVHEVTLDALKLFVRLIKNYSSSEQVPLSSSQIAVAVLVVKECQSLFHASVEKAGDGDGCRLYTGSLRPSYHAHFILYFWTALVHIDEPDSFAESVCTTLADYVSFVESTFSQSDLMTERSYLGSLLFKLGLVLWKQDLQRPAVQIYTAACEQLVLFCSAQPENVAARIEEAVLLARVEVLVRCQITCGRLEEAKVTIVRVLTLTADVDVNADAVSSLVNCWVKVTLKASEEGNEKLVCWTLTQSLLQSSLTKSQVMALTKKEFQGLASLRSRVHKAEVAVLQGMVKMASDAHDKASALLYLAQTVWLTGSEHLPGDPLQYVEKAAGIVRRSDDQLLWGNICCWRYILLHEQTCQNFDRARKQGDDAGQDGEKKVDMEADVLSAFLDLPRTMADHQGELSGLIQAVESWEGGVKNSEMERMSEFEKKQMLGLFLMCADILRCQREFLLELRVLCLAYKVSPSSGCERERLTTAFALINVLAVRGVDDATCPVVIEEATHCTANKDQYIVHLARANWLLKAGQAADAGLVLQQLADHPWKRSVSDQLYKGVLNRLRAEYLLLPRHLRSETSRSEYAVDYIIDGFRSHLTTLHKSLELDATDRMAEGKTYRDPLLWQLLAEYLQSVLLLCQIYRHIGDLKRARCYLKEGLKVSESQGWVKWTAIFTVELAHVHWLADNMADAVQALAVSALSLTTGVSGDVNVQDVEAWKTSELKSSTHAVSVNSSGDGHETVLDVSADLFPELEGGEKAEDENGPSFLQVVCTKLGERHGRLLLHDSDCDCLYCQDKECQRLVVLQGLMLVRVTQCLFPTIDKAVDVLADLDNLCQTFQMDMSSQVCAVLQESGVLGKGFQRSSASSAGHREVMDQVELLCLKAELFLQCQKLTETYRTVEKGLDLLGSSDAHRADLYMLKSKFNFLGAQALILMLPRDTQHSGGGGGDDVVQINKQDLEDRVAQRLADLQLVISGTKAAKTSLPGDHENTGGAVAGQMVTKVEASLPEQAKSRKERASSASNRSRGGSGRRSTNQAADTETTSGKKTTVAQKQRADDQSSSSKAASSRQATKCVASKKAGPKNSAVDKDGENKLPAPTSPGVAAPSLDVFDFSDSDDDVTPLKDKNATASRGRQRAAPRDKPKLGNAKSTSAASKDKPKDTESGSTRSASAASKTKTKDTKLASTRSSKVKQDPDSQATPSCPSPPASTTTRTRSSRTTRGQKRQTEKRSAGDDLEPVEVARALSDDENGRKKNSARTTKKSGGVKKPAVNKKCVEKAEEGATLTTEQKRCKIHQHLHEVMTLTCHVPPVGMYSHACKSLAAEFKDRDVLERAALLSESAAVGLRHQFLLNLSKQIRNCKTEGAAAGEGDENVARKRALETLRETLLFPWGPADLQRMLHVLPAGWTVCQFSLIQHCHGPDSLVLTRLAHTQDPIIVTLDGFSRHGQSVLSEFQEIMAGNQEARNISDKVTWWKKRVELDMRLETLLPTLERAWLGAWRCLLIGQMSDKTYQDKLAAAAKPLAKQLSSVIKKTIDIKVAKMLLDLSRSVETERDLPIILAHFLDLDVCDPQMTSVVTLVEAARPKVTVTPDQPVILILDKCLHALPWENLPVLQGQQVTRVPSVWLLNFLLKVDVDGNSVVRRGVDPNNTFYMLDPDNNLSHTVSTFKDMFREQLGWEGVVGERPSKELFCGALTDHDMFLYCGHGSGSQYVAGDEVGRLSCRAVPVLMGCSSASVKVTSQLQEPFGFVFNYLMACCPSVVGNLWDVTDRDIDRFLKHLLELWLHEHGDEPPSLPSLIPAARGACKMRHLIGGAPVVYGLPVTLNKPRRTKQST